ncbi:MAG: GTPase, partial [Deltaproteobacteria bacterium]|nr:GTPase [Deltaproteobacteria bacterium]
QAVQRLASYADLERHGCTIEEREEYELHIDRGYVVYAGVDYQAVVRRAELECDVLLWDGGNNDLPFVRPDLWITVADPLRPGHETEFYPGEANLRAADVVIVAKATDAPTGQVQAVVAAAQAANPSATVLRAGSRLVVPDGEQLRGKRVLLVDDGPTLTHGGMPFGAAQVAAQRYGAAELADPKPHAVGSMAETFQKFPHLHHTLPAMGYSAGQVAELEATINATPCDVVVYATPIDLGRLLHLGMPAVRVQYEYEELDTPGLGAIVDEFAQLLHRD